MSKSEDVEVVYGSGNVYRDFGYADADARLAKDILAAEIIRVLNPKDYQSGGGKNYRCEPYRVLPHQTARP